MVLFPPAPPAPPKRLYSFADLHALGVPHSMTQLWRNEKAGIFPRRVPISPQRVAWVASEVDEWISNLGARREPVQTNMPSARGDRTPRAPAREPGPPALPPTPALSVPMPPLVTLPPMQGDLPPPPTPPVPAKRGRGRPPGSRNKSPCGART